MLRKYIVLDTSGGSVSGLCSSACKRAEVQFLHIPFLACNALNPTFEVSCYELMFSFFQNCGVGKFKPNILVMGFKSNWENDNPDLIYQYFMTVQ